MPLTRQHSNIPHKYGNMTILLKIIQSIEKLLVNNTKKY